MERAVINDSSLKIISSNNYLRLNEHVWFVLTDIQMEENAVNSDATGQSMFYILGNQPMRSNSSMSVDNP